MKNLNRFLALMLTLVLALSCAPALAEGALTVTDMTGRETTLEGPASCIVALTASDVEILYAIGAGDALVGRGEYCNYPAEALEVISVQSGYETNIEQILALEPDVVLMATMAQPVEQVEQLEAAGIHVIVSDAKDIAGVYEAIALIGAVTGHDAEAEALVKSMQDAFSEYEGREDTGKSVYFEISPLQWGLWAAGKGTFMDEIAGMLGLTNIFADVEGWVEVSEEQVLARNPDYIVTTAMYYGEGPTPVEEIMSRAGWENIAAVQSGAVFNADNDEITRPGPRLVNAIEALDALVNQ